jgi:D-serine deaminase-like pyridoxal phosphate-dependent protein
LLPSVAATPGLGYAAAMEFPFPMAEVPTPALLLDRAALDRNIAAMAEFARARGLKLRPHAKTHKSADIAKRQVAGGAVGICCAKLAEAEALAAEGVEDIHLTSPVVTPQAVARLVALSRQIALSVVADHPENVAALAATGAQLRVLVDVDPGARRTGVASAAAAVALVRAIAAAPSLEFAGVQYYCGSLQHIQAEAVRRAALAERTDYLGSVLAAIRADGHDVPLVTGGGTGSFAIDADLGVLTELQVGSFIFLDREYSDCELGGPRFESSLTIAATVISANAQGMVTVDAGLKAMATDAGLPRVVVPAGARYAFMGDEHGAVLGEALPGLGGRAVLMPPHCDPTANLHDRYFVCEGDEVVAIWPVTARGRGW